jgi:hypothetical protein
VSGCLCPETGEREGVAIGASRTRAERSSSSPYVTARAGNPPLRNVCRGSAGRRLRARTVLRRKGRGRRAEALRYARSPVPSSSMHPAMPPGRSCPPHGGSGDVEQFCSYSGDAERMCRLHSQVREGLYPRERAQVAQRVVHHVAPRDDAHFKTAVPREAPLPPAEEDVEVGPASETVASCAYAAAKQREVCLSDGGPAPDGPWPMVGARIPPVLLHPAGRVAARRKRRARGGSEPGRQENFSSRIGAEGGGWTSTATASLRK